MKIIVTPSKSRASEELAERFREALRRSGLSLDRLVVRLAEHGHQVSRTTLSNWQRGRTRPVRSDSLAAIPDLEMLLGLAPGALRADGVETVDDAESAFETLSLQESSYVSPWGWSVRRETRQVIRATRPGVSHVDVRMAGGDQPPQARVVAGGSPAEPILDDDGTWRVPVQLGRHLAPGETHYLELTWEGAAREMDRVVAEPIAQMLLRVTFHPEDAPAAVLARLATHTQRVSLDSQATAHCLVVQPRSGSYRLEGIEQVEVARCHQA